MHDLRSASLRKPYLRKSLFKNLNQKMPRVKLFNEDEVLQKATELFWKRGYHATSIQDLVTHLGINRASIYDTYGGKRELFDKAFLRYWTENSERIVVFFATQPVVKEGLRKLFEIVVNESLNDCDRKGCFVVNSITELVPDDETIRPELIAHKEMMENIFLNYLQTGVENGEISSDKDLKTIAGLLLTFYSGVKVVGKIDDSNAQLQNATAMIGALLG